MVRLGATIGQQCGGYPYGHETISSIGQHSPLSTKLQDARFQKVQCNGESKSAHCPLPIKMWTRDQWATRQHILLVQLFV